MSEVIFEYDLKKHGINKTIKIKLRQTVNGFTPEQKFPRDEVEQIKLAEIIAQELALNKSDVVNDALVLGERRKNLINDPIGTLLKEQGAKAFDSPAGPGVNIGTSIGELTELFPGGKTFEPGKAGKGVVNTLAALASGYGGPFGDPNDRLQDPKQLITDLGVIGTDMALAAQLMNSDITPKYGHYSTRNLIMNMLKKNPVYGVPAVIATNVAAKYGGDILYDKLNDMTRFIMQLPDPEAAYANNEKIRNLIDARDELLWTSGAMGLQYAFPAMKRLLGKTVGVNKGMQFKVGEVMDDTGQMIPVHEDLLKLAKQYDIPMNVFSTSPSGFIKGAGSVIGLFPFVATKARRAQNAQQVALAQNINNVLNDLSPIGLFKDAKVLTNQSFKNMINNFTATKTALYTRALGIADKVGDKFIPTARIKEQAQNLEILLYGPGGRPTSGEGNLRLNQPTYNRPQSVDELLRGFTSKTDEFTDALIDLQYLKDDFITGREFKKLQTQLNQLKKYAAGDPKMGTELGGIDNFTDAMIKTLNDFENFKKFEDPAKQALVKEFGGAMGIANNFFFDNVNFTKGRVAQILGLADKNIAKATGDIDPGMLTGEQILKILFNDETMYSPAAIKEMQKAMPPVKLPDGRVVDPVKAVARAWIDDSLRAHTKYISGDLRVTGEAGPIQKTRSWLTGKEIVGQKTKTFNIPIIDVQEMRKSFGLDNPNKMEAMQMIFGKEQYDKIRNVLALGEHIQQTSFGDVSAFVKRRGFLGGINAITNLAFAGFVANNPFGNVGWVLAARYGMSKMADPKFMDGLTQIMNPELPDMVRRTALINTIALTPELALGMNEGKEDVPPELQNLDTGNPYDVMKYLIFGAENNASYPGGENMSIKIGKDGRATGVELSKVDSKNEFSIDAQGVAEDIQTVDAESIGENVTSQVSKKPKDPFLDVDFNEIVKQTGSGMGINQAQKTLTQDQRVALAGGDLDEAIAMGNRRV